MLRYCCLRAPKRNNRPRHHTSYISRAAPSRSEDLHAGYTSSQKRLRVLTPFYAHLRSQPLPGPPSLSGAEVVSIHSHSRESAALGALAVFDPHQLETVRCYILRPGQYCQSVDFCFMFLLIDVEAMLIVECLFANSALLEKVSVLGLFSGTPAN